MEEFVETTKLSTSEIAELAGVSPSAVSQWLGKGTKTIHSIGQIEAAIKLERKTGYSALWLAKGKGVKMVERSAEAVAIDHAAALRFLANLIAPTSELKRKQLEPLLSMLALHPERVDEIATEFADLLKIPSGTGQDSRSARDFGGVLEDKGLSPNGKYLRVPAKGNGT